MKHDLCLNAAPEQVVIVLVIVPLSEGITIYFNILD